jgi:hypothetical protein
MICCFVGMKDLCNIKLQLEYKNKEYLSYMYMKFRFNYDI